MHCLQDDLAEHAVASPVPYEGDDEWNDQSRYEYWNDIEYDSDGYNDVDGKGKKKPTEQLRVPGTTKRKAPPGPETPSKRRKVHRQERSASIPPVVWRNRDDIKEPEAEITSVAELKPVSLLEDWKERFRDAKGFGTAKAPQDAEEDLLDHPDAIIEGNEAEEANGVGGMQLGPEVLKIALRKNLESIGLDGAKINEATLLKLATRMTADMSKADELLGEFVESLLGNEEDEEADQFSQWALKKAEEASKDRPKEASDDQTTDSNAAPSVEETKAMDYTLELDPNTNVMGVLPESSIPSSKNHRIKSPDPSRRLKRKAESPTSPSRKKKVNRAPDQVRASS